jgi:hypothetical protein
MSSGRAPIRGTRIAARWLDIRNASLIRVNRRTARSNDYGFTTSWLRGCSITAALRGSRASSETTESSVSQVCHAHGGEYSTTELDPSHRTTSPSLGNLKTNESSLTRSRSSWLTEQTSGHVAISQKENSPLPATPIAVHSDRFTWIDYRHQTRPSI